MGVAGFTTAVYLPWYSEAGVQRRTTPTNKNLDESKSILGGTRGSMWQNIHERSRDGK